MSFGISLKLNQPVLGSTKNIFFLHKVFFEQQTFEYTNDKSLFYSFDTRDIAQAWFDSWYQYRKGANMVLPSYAAFSVMEIPGTNTQPLLNTLPVEQGGNLIGGGPSENTKPKF